MNFNEALAHDSKRSEVLEPSIRATEESIVSWYRREQDKFRVAHALLEDELRDVMRNEGFE